LRALAREIVAAGVKGVILIGGGGPPPPPHLGWGGEDPRADGTPLRLPTHRVPLPRHLKAIAGKKKRNPGSSDARTAPNTGRIRPDRSGRSQFESAIRNMESLARIKRGTLGYSFMIYSEGRFDPKNPSDGDFTNVREIAQAARVARDAGCDYFELKPMYDL